MKTPETSKQTSDAKPHSLDPDGWKHEPVTSEQAERIIDTLKGIKTWCGWILWFAILIWMNTMWHK